MGNVEEDRLNDQGSTEEIAYLPTFKEARVFELTFGRHKGSYLDRVAETDSGLRYLAWLKGAKEAEGKTDTPLYRNLAAYLSDPTIADELERVS